MPFYAHLFIFELLMIKMFNHEKNYFYSGMLNDDFVPPEGPGDRYYR